MKINARLEGTIINRLFLYHSYFSTRRVNNVYSPSLNTSFIRTLLNTEDNTVIIPGFIFNVYTKSINSNNIGTFDSVLPLSIGYNQEYKSPDSILVNLLTYMPCRDNGLTKITSAKYGTYYGAEGFIMDKDFNILFMSAYKGKYEKGKLYVNNIVTYINPKVSLADNGVEKYIYTKIAPLCLTGDIKSSVNSVNSYIGPEFNINIPLTSTPIVIFEDVTSKFLIKPIIPNTSVEDDIQNILMSSIDDIVYSMNVCQ